MLTPFLTDIDSRAAVKGSRDPLGIQAIWTRFGRHVVGNLTTVSTSVVDFVTLLLGHYFIERVKEKSDDEDDLGIFLRWEQLAGYARAEVNGDISFRGTDRARLNLQENFIRLSADRIHQILANQKIYGLWGLYTVPARASGLLEGDPARLTASARAFIEREYLPRLSRHGLGDGRAIVEKLRGPSAKLDHRGRDAKLLAGVASLLQRELTITERRFFYEHLVLGGPADRTDGIQRQFADILAPTLGNETFAFSPQWMSRLIRAAGEETPLGDRLTRIQLCESVIAPSSILFSFALSGDGERIEAFANLIRDRWGSRLPTIDAERIRSLRPELVSATGESEAATRWLGVGASLSAGDYEEATRLLIDHNQHVMAARGGSAPWIGVRSGRLHVRFRDEGAILPGKDELPNLWRHPYFMVSLRDVAGAVSEA